MPASNDPSDAHASPSDPATAMQLAKQHFLQALQALEQRQWQAAASGFESVTRLAPAVEAGHFNLGNALFELKRFNEAIQAYLRAQALSPMAGTLNNLGNAYSATMQWPQASDCYRRALDMLDAQATASQPNPAQPNPSQSSPSHPNPADVSEKNSLIHNLSQALEHWGRHAEAAELLWHYWPRPASPKQLNFLLRNCLWIPADQRLRDVLKMVDDLPSPSAQTLLLAADCYHHLQQYSDELVCLVKASQLAADHSEVLFRMARHQQFRGRHPEATLCLHRTLTTASASASLQSGWIRNMLYQSTTEFEQLHRETTSWASAHAVAQAAPAQSDANRQFRRLGWIITEDTPTWFLESLSEIVYALASLSVECVIYSDLTIASASRSMLNESIDKCLHANWKSTAKLSDQQLYELIIADQVDCLVDVSGHGPHTRLPVFAHRAAPRQISLSHTSTTSGLAAMDTLLTGAGLIPKAAECHFTESLVTIDPFIYLKPMTSLLADRTRDHLLDPTAARAGIRLGIACSPDCLTREFLIVVAGALTELPTAVLAISHPTCFDTGLQRELLDRCIQAGIPSSQVTVNGRHRSEWADWLNTIDLLIDSIPIGHLESVVAALSTGVPAVASAGNTMAARLTSSVLSQLGLEEYVAQSHGEYRELIVRIATQLKTESLDEGRRRLPESIRGRLINSPLCDAERYARELIKSLR